MHASFLTPDPAIVPDRPTAMPRRSPLAVGLLGGCLLVAAGSALAGIVFDEAETIARGSAGETRQLRQVLVQGDACKIVITQSSDPLEPAGSYFLTTPAGSFFIDPIRATVAPVVPADMHPVGRPPGTGRVEAPVRAVSLVRELDEAGPQMLGLPTRHYVYVLHYQQPDAGQERHEFWATDALPADPGLAVWRERRVNEDAGTGAERALVQDVIGEMHAHGLFLRHVIERRTARQAGVAAGPDERIVREITRIDVQDVPPDTFRRPAGLSDTEFLVPAPDEAEGAAGAPDISGESGPAPGPVSDPVSIGE